MNKENCALKLVDEIILYYDARSKKHQIITTNRHVFTVHKIYTRQLYRWSNTIRKILIQLTVQL